MFLARIGEIVSIGNHPSMIPKRWRSLELIYSSARIICTKRGWNLNPDGRLTNEKEREREEGRRRLEILQLSKSGFHAYIYIHTSVIVSGLNTHLRDFDAYSILASL